MVFENRTQLASYNRQSFIAKIADERRLISCIDIVKSKLKREVVLDEMYFSDYYMKNAHKRSFLGQLVYDIKTYEMYQLIDTVVHQISQDISYLLNENNFEFVAFVPPSKNRRFQFNELLKSRLKLPLREIALYKSDQSKRVEQKQIIDYESKCINASNSISVFPNLQIDGDVLIIDDVTDSGATMNEIANKIKSLSKNKHIKVVSYTVVGNGNMTEFIKDV